MAKPPLALSAVSIAADGSETIWWSGDRFAYNRPQQLSFRTKIGEGFSDASVTLARRIDRDYHDINLYDDVVFVSDDGQTPYEGRIGANPRSTSGGHSILVQCAGWMEHARDRKFTEIYVDRDLSAWGQISTQRQADLLTGGYNIFNADVKSDSSKPSVATRLTAPWASLSDCEAVYDAGPGIQIGSIYYAWEQIGANFANFDWRVATYSSDRLDAGTLITQTADLQAAGPGTGTLTVAAGARYGVLRFGHVAVQTGSAEFTVQWQNLAVFGTHELTKRGTAPEGLYASDVITNIVQRFCPKLNTAGVQGTTLAIPHIVFRDRTTPFDAFLLLNGPHGWQLAVWEGRTLHFEPYDLTDFDWQVRMDQPGVDLSLQGDTTTDLANYAVVEFDNVLTGKRDSVSPSDSSDLEDLTVDHPANAHGLDVELTIPLTFPTTPDMAIQFGRSYLAEFNRPKTRGQITVQGHILDRAGHWWQGWKPRAGETIAVVDHPNDSPRLITETAWDHPSRTMTISTDNGELNQLDAVVDRIQTALVANNLR